MNKYKETFETWDKAAFLYQDKFMDLDLYNETYDYICNFITKEKAKILEIGCGPGNITRYLLSKRPDFDIFAIDIAPNMIELAKKNNPSAIFEIMDTRNIAQIHTKYDGIVCGFCIPYLSHLELEKFIADSRDLLTDNGLIYLSFVEGDPKNSDFQISSSGDRVFFNFHNLEELKRLLIVNKFKDIKVLEIEYDKLKNERQIHTIIIAYN